LLNDHCWIFVNYVPGAFGSFITKVIETSPDVYNIDGKVFDKHGASHKNIAVWFHNFHDGDELDAWAKLNKDDQISYVYNALNTKLYNSTTLYKVHRFTNPSKHHLFVNMFPQAKFVKVVFSSTYLNKIVDQMVQKTFDGWFETQCKIQNPDLYKILNNVPVEYQLAHYRKECIARIESTIDNSVDERTMLFNAKDLFNDRAVNTFDKMFKFLNIAPGNYDTLLQEFLKIHSDLG